MKTKIWIITAVSFILIGSIIFGGVMIMLKWDFNKLSTAKYETNTYEINDSYKHISIAAKTGDINFVRSDNNKTKIVCYEYENAKHNVDVKQDTLVIKLDDARKWYEYITIFSFETPKITVYLPQDKYNSLSIDTSTSDIKIPKDFAFDNIDIKASTGDVACNASAVNDLKIKLSTGDIKLKNITAGDINLSLSTGETHLTDVKCNSLVSKGSTGDMKLTNVIATKDFNITRSTGDIKFEGCDADELLIETDTGDVSGNLLNSKIFICKTNTGRINAPKTTTGGKCEITTDTGNIKIEIGK